MTTSLKSNCLSSAASFLVENDYVNYQQWFLYGFLLAFFLFLLYFSLSLFYLLLIVCHDSENMYFPAVASTAVYLSFIAIESEIAFLTTHSTFLSMCVYIYIYIFMHINLSDSGRIFLVWLYFYSFFTLAHDSWISVSDIIINIVVAQKIDTQQHFKI